MPRLAALRYDARHAVGSELAGALIAAAATSVGQHHGEPYRRQVRYAVEDLDLGRDRFHTAGTLAAFVGAVPGLRQSGKRRGQRAGLRPLGHGPLRAPLWMPTLSAVRFNPWLRACYERLIARGRLPEVAVIAAMRKLLLAVYSGAKNRRPFVPHFTPQETPA